METEVTKTSERTAVAREIEVRRRWELKVAELRMEFWRTEQANRRLEQKIL